MIVATVAFLLETVPFVFVVAPVPDFEPDAELIDDVIKDEDPALDMMDASSEIMPPSEDS